MTVTVRAFERPEELFERAEGFLRADALVNNLPLAICEGLVKEPDPAAPLLLSLEDGGRCAGLAVMRQGQPLVVTDLPGAAITALAEFLRSQAIAVPELHAPEGCAERLVLELARDRAPGYALRRVLIIYAVEAHETVNEPPSPGLARLAQPAERALIARWFVEFGAETGFVINHPEEFAESRIVAGRAAVYDVAGELVSLACIGGQARGLARVGPVYTPVAERGRGYGSALVAWVTRGILERGDHACLFADADNPASNRLYVRLGYREIGRVSAHERLHA